MNFRQNLAMAMQRVDGWANLLTGLGTARDKRTHTTFNVPLAMGDQEFENLYTYNDLAARIVDTIPDEALRKGFDVKIEDEDNPEQVTEIAEDIQSQLSDLDALAKTIEAHTWARLYGGAALLVGADDGSSIEQLAEPLAEDRIRSIKYLTVLEKRYLTARTWYSDPNAANYGYPETFEITSAIGGADNQYSGYPIHETRFILFDGVRVPISRRQQNNGWGDSVLRRVNDVLRDFGVGWDAVGHLLVDGSQAVYKMAGLIDMVSSQNTSLINSRMEAVDLGRSIARAIVLDADPKHGESFERQSYNFAGVDKILQMFILRLSAAARMPATVLMGQSPAGENATGEADFQWFYSTIQTVQNNYLKRKIERLIELILLSKEGPTKGIVPDDWNIEFAPLWELNPQQTADMRLKVAQTDQIYIDRGVMLPEEATLSRFRPDGWSMETSVDLDLRRNMLEIEKDKEIENLENPPVPPVLPEPGTPPDPGEGDDQDGPQEDEKKKLDSLPGAQTRAKDAVNNAIKMGKLKRPSTCSKCGSSKNIQAHHPDHNKPLQVVWVCASCHKKLQDRRRGK